MAKKATADIHNWVALPNKDDPRYLIGEVRNHPRQNEFSTKVQRTSRIMTYDFRNGVVETENTIYKLREEASS